MSIVGGAVQPSVELQNLLSPGDSVNGPDARRLRTRPQFQILWPVVVFNAVAVVDRLPGQKVAPEDLLHHEDVLEHVRASGSSWMARGPDHDVARLVAGLPSLPVAVRWAGHGPARAAGRRLVLLRGSA